MRLRRPESLFVLIGLVVVGGVLWALIDAPTDTGIRKTGTIVSCRGGTRTSSTCAVKLSGSQAVIVLDAPGHRVGDVVTVAVMKRSISGAQFDRVLIGR